VKKPWHKSEFANPGRRKVACERLQVPEEYLPVGRAEASSVSDIVPLVLKRLGVEDRSWLDRLVAEWAELAGAAIAAHTRPGMFEKGCLVVFVDSSVWLNELSRYGRRQMLSLLQKHFGAERIRQIVLRIDPGS
jgi:predicted nucleic acid-binding Zn ribbon protein